MARPTKVVCISTVIAFFCLFSIVQITRPLHSASRLRSSAISELSQGFTRHTFQEVSSRTAVLPAPLVVATGPISPIEHFRPGQPRTTARVSISPRRERLIYRRIPASSSDSPDPA
jgi:hypothetical protein